VPYGHALTYGVATIDRLFKIIGLFCRILSLLQVSFTKETYHFKEPTNRSHPILCLVDTPLTHFVFCRRDMYFRGSVLRCVAVCVAVCCSVLHASASMCLIDTPLRALYYRALTYIEYTYDYIHYVHTYILWKNHWRQKCICSAYSHMGWLLIVGSINV